MGKKIVISFPGSRGYEIPLLYFASKHYEDLGYEKLFINYPTSDESNVETINYYIEPNVGHRMEVKGDLNRNLKVIANVITQIK